MSRILFLCLLILFPFSAFAEETHQELLSRKIEVNFIPEKAFLIVDYSDGALQQYQALLIPPINKAESDLNISEWIAGTYVKSSPGSTPTGYSVFLKGKQAESALLPRMIIEASAGQPYANSVDLMKEQISIRKKILESLQVQNNTQAANLKRLRADAEVIANLSRIVEIVEETEVVKSEIENLDKDLELLRSTFQAVKNMSQPKNYIRREFELTKQADEFIKLVTVTETGEDARKNVSQEDIQKKLGLIEQTRFEDEEKLKQQLIRLKTRPTSGAANTIPPQDAGTDPVKNYWETQ
jgi:hypothetical protein